MLAHEWRQRRRRAESTCHRFAQLWQWDERIQAYIEAFALLGHEGSERAHDRLQAPISEGELFALSSQALIARNRSLAQACIGMVQAMPGFLEAFCSALDWVDWPGVEFALGLWPAEDSLRQAAVLHSIASHDLVVDSAQIASWISRLSHAPAVQHGALRCALLTGQADWAVRAFDLADAASPPELRLAAVEALIVFSEDAVRRDALRLLRELALGSGRVAAVATRELMTLGGIEASQLLEALAAEPTRVRQQIAAMGWSGQLAHLPGLADLLDDPTHGRAAGAAITMLTGSDPPEDGWASNLAAPRAASEPLSDRMPDHIPPADPDAELPQPDRAQFAVWWNATRARYALDERYLAGRPRSAEHLTTVLRQGRLAHRPQASWLLQVARRGQGLAHLAPAPRQLAQINQITQPAQISEPKEALHHG